MTERGDFATLLRAWRDRLHPEAAGFPANGRRAAGLRREELAALTGISVDYVVRLEQGRADHPSDQVVTALARALQLSEHERDQLFAAAGLAAPLPTTVPTHVPPSVLRLLRSLDDVSVSVFAADWTQLHANATWEAVFGQAAPPGRGRNLVWQFFTGTPTRLVREPVETDRFTRAVTADLRITSLRYPEDDGLRALVADLRRVSPEFDALWLEAPVAHHVSERKTIDHPAVGHVLLDCDVLVVPGTDIKVVTHTAEPGTPDRSKLDLIRTLGAVPTIPAG